MLTDFGKMLKNLCVNADMKEEDLAKELDCSTGTVSNYVNGKTIPEIRTLVKCVEVFNLNNKELKDFFAKAFDCTINKKQKLDLDSSYFRKERLESLVKVLVIFLLYSKNDAVMNDYSTKISLEFDSLKGKINTLFIGLDHAVELPVSQTGI